MKLYRTSQGSWINLGLCHRFYVTKAGDKYDIEASIDISDAEPVILVLEWYFNTETEAQATLDKIMSKINGTHS